MTITRHINDAGFALIKSFESCRLEPYLDSAGIPTCGWGHVNDVTMDMAPITQEQADEWLSDDLINAEEAVCDNMPESLTDNQFSALVSLVFNCGTAPLDGHLGEDINQGHLDQAAEEWLKWDHASGVVVGGLLRRREAELALFQTT